MVAATTASPVAFSTTVPFISNEFCATMLAYTSAIMAIKMHIFFICENFSAKVQLLQMMKKHKKRERGKIAVETEI